MNDRPLTGLNGKIHVKHGFPFKGEHFKPTGTYVVLTPGNFFEQGGFKRNAGKDKCYSEPFPEEYLLRKGDIVVAMTEQADGLLGSMAKIPEDNRFLHNQRLGLVTSLTDEVNVEFLYHLFKTRSVRQQLRNSASGSKVKHTSPERIYDVQVPLPEPMEQAAIAKLMTLIDDQIDINNHVNDELEGMAKLLYDYWFVQFDFPITAAQAAAMGKPRLEGKPYRASGGKMVYDDTLKRDIPAAWDVCALSKFARTGSGGTPTSTKREYYEGGKITWINSGEVNLPYIVSGANFITQAGLDNSSAKLLPSRTLLIALYGATAGKVSILLTEACLNQAVCGILPNDPSMLFYLKFFLSHLYDHLVLMSSGSARDNLSQDLVRNINVIVPPADLLERFHAYVDAGVAIIANNMRQNEELSALRDWLLPMLMNGQVTVT